jgi:general secretion pathway protein I
MPRPGPRRRGLSLIEVLLAMAILMLSLAAIGQLVDMGSFRGIEARFHVQGTRLAQAKMAEYEAGVADVTSGGAGEFTDNDDDHAWRWTVDSQPDTPANLYKVTVTVTRDYRGKDFSITLSQMIFDPNMTGSAAQAERPTQADVDAAETNGGTGTATTGTMP